jgi:hypothetical protein
MECKKAVGQYPATRGFALPEAADGVPAERHQVCKKEDAN